MMPKGMIKGMPKPKMGNMSTGGKKGGTKKGGKGGKC
jgi:hypothetical protein